MIGFFVVVFVVAVLAVLLVHGGLIPAPRPLRVLDDPDPLTDGYTDDEVSGAALKMLRGIDYCSFLAGGDGEERYRRCVQSYASLRAKYAEHPSKRLRKALMEWIDYYDGRNEEGVKEWRLWQRRDELARKANK